MGNGGFCESRNVHYTVYLAASVWTVKRMWGLSSQAVGSEIEADRM